jgi:hypothetical protein
MQFPFTVGLIMNSQFDWMEVLTLDSGSQTSHETLKYSLHLKQGSTVIPTPNKLIKPLLLLVHLSELNNIKLIKTHVAAGEHMSLDHFILFRLAMMPLIVTGERHNGSGHIFSRQINRIIKFTTTTGIL